MVIYKAYKFRMYPNKEQIPKLNSFLGSSRFIYNYFLNKKEEIYKETKKNYNLKDMCSDLKCLYKEYEWLKEIDSCALRTSLFDLEDAYTRYFNNQNEHPKYKKRNTHNSYRTNCIRNSYKDKQYTNIKLDLKNKTIKLPKLEEIKIKGYRKINNINGRIINATITKENNRYYVAVCIEENKPLEEFILKNAIGIDLGIKNLVITSDGIKYKKMQAIKKYERKIRGLNKWLSRCEKGSKNRKKVIEKLNSVYRKLKNTRKYYTHFISNILVKENDIIVTEDLDVKKMIEEKKISKYLSDSSMSEIIRQLEYKTKWQNKKLIKIPRYYASSQICNHCGNKNREMKNLNIRKWVCKKCNQENDRDINASINILEKGIEEYFKEQYAN